MIGHRTIDGFLYHYVEKSLDELDQNAVLQYPVYIPSRGRAHYNLVTDLFDQDSIDYKIVVEPQDQEAYTAKYGADRVLVMDKNNQGIAYVRNYMKQHATESGYDFHWQFDDDIRGFAVRRNGKSVRTNPRPLLAIVENSVNRFNNIGGAVIASMVYAWGYDKKPPVIYNSTVYTAMLLNNHTRATFEPGIVEDTDYTLQLLAAGWVTLVFKRFGVETPVTETMTGGNTDIEHTRRYERNQALVEKWPGIFRNIQQSDGRWVLRSSKGYRGFRQLPQPAH